MSKRKMTRAVETAIRGSDQIMVIAASQLADNISPNSITTNSITPETVFIPNSSYIIFEDSLGAYSNCYIVRDVTDRLNIGNLKASGTLALVATMASGNQRALVFRELGAADTLELFHDYNLTITTNNNYVELNGKVGVKMRNLPTSDPHVVDAIWNSAGTLKISAG